MSVTTGLLFLGVTLETLTRSSKYPNLLNIPVFFDHYGFSRYSKKMQRFQSYAITDKVGEGFVFYFCSALNPSFHSWKIAGSVAAEIQLSKSCDLVSYARATIYSVNLDMC